MPKLALGSITVLATVSVMVLSTSAIAMVNHSFHSTNRMISTSKAGETVQKMNQSISTSKQISSSQSHETRINLDAAALNQPHVLNVSANAGAQLTGRVTVNGVTIREINQTNVAIDLAPHLSPGNNRVEITGSYQPGTASVSIEFSGPGTSIVQQSSGTGLLQHRLMFEVY